MIEVPLEEVLADGRLGPPYARWPPQFPGNRLEPEAWPQMFPRFAIEPGATVLDRQLLWHDIEDHLHEQGLDAPMIGFQVGPAGYGDSRTSVLNRFTPTAMHRRSSGGAGS